MDLKIPWFREVKIRMFFSLLFLIVVLTFFLNTDDQKVFNRATCREKHDMEAKSFFIKVEFKYNDSLNHNYNTIRYLDLHERKQASMYVINEVNGFYNSVQIGDTLKKEKVSLDVRCLNRDTIYALSYNCIEKLK
jgi:hypothetical protein